jgi:hypothetical protein
MNSKKLHVSFSCAHGYELIQGPLPPPLMVSISYLYRRIKIEDLAGSYSTMRGFLSRVSCFLLRDILVCLLSLKKDGTFLLSPTSNQKVRY